MLHWDDDAINEASGLAYSLKWANLVYVCNDENGPIYIVDLKTMKTVGTIRIKGVSLIDPESLCIDSKGILWVADIGDNGSNRSDVRLYFRGEPGPGYHGEKPWTRYIIKYSGGARNAETLICWPNGRVEIVSKASSGSVYRLPDSRPTKTAMTLSAVVSSSSALDTVTDAVASKDGKWAFVLLQGSVTTISVFNSSWALQDTFVMSAMDKPEGIAIQQDGKTLIVCDDNSRTPGGKVQKVKIPGKWCPAGSKKYDDDTPVVGADPAPALPANPCAA